jgi:hypothetical protein
MAADLFAISIALLLGCVLSGALGFVVAGWRPEA